jgi:hypothetical protein
MLLRLQGKVRKANSEPPEQPDLELTRKVKISAPTWLPESDERGKGLPLVSATTRFRAIRATTCCQTGLV